MMPILYPADETAFDTNGIGILSDVVDCTVIEVLNSKFELEMQYPVTGNHFKEIRQRSLILAKPDPVTDPQPFRVYRITKPMDGRVMVYARHLVYDLVGITVAPFSAGSAVSALQNLKSNATSDCPFSFYTDMGTAGEMKAEVPTPIWSLMGSSEGMILDTYGGEYQFDFTLVRLLNQRGADRGVSIRYGKNLTSLEQDENCADCYTAVHPYWKSSDGVLVQLPEKVVNAPGNYGYTRTVPLDCSQQWETAPSEEMLRAYATEYVKDNKIGIPKTAWKIEFVEVEKSEEYKGTALLERVLLGDTVSVDYEDLDVSAIARVNEARYKPILERYESVTLGDVKANLADTLINQQRQLDRKTTYTQLQMAMMALTAAITGAKGGSVRLLDNDGDGEPDTLYIADHPDPEQAIKVWRFNYEGWGASKNGYNGPFIIGASFDSGILADFITAGTLYGVLVKACVIESEDGRIKIDLANKGGVPVFNTGIKTNGIQILDDESGQRLFGLDSYKLSSTKSIASFNMYSVAGHALISATESYDLTNDEPSGVDFVIEDSTRKSKVHIDTEKQQSNVRCRAGGSSFGIQMQANEKATGLYLTNDLDEIKAGMMYQKSTGKSEMAIDKIVTDELYVSSIDGKKLEWYVMNGVSFLVAAE